MRGVRGVVDGRELRAGGSDYGAGGRANDARGEWTGSADDCRSTGTEDSAVGERDSRISVSAMEYGSASGAFARGISACGQENWSSHRSGRIRAIRAAGQAGAIARRSRDGRRRLQSESDYISTDVAAAVGVLPA